MAGGDRGSFVEHRAAFGHGGGHHRLVGLGDRKRFTGQGGLVGFQRDRLQHPAVGRHGVAGVEHDHVTGHQVVGGYHPFGAGSADPGGDRRPGQQLGQGLFGVALVDRADQRGSADHPADEGSVDERTEAGGEHRPGGEHRGERVGQLVDEGPQQAARAGCLAGAGGLPAFGLGVGEAVGSRVELVEDRRHRHQVPGGDRGGG